MKPLRCVLVWFARQIARETPVLLSYFRSKAAEFFGSCDYLAVPSGFNFAYHSKLFREPTGHHPTFGSGAV